MGDITKNIAILYHVTADLPTLTVLTTISRSYDFSQNSHDKLKISHEMEDLSF